jgi:anhydro-N-acetylmuramic acid kinase
LNALDYYKKPFPKSLGFEFVKETVLPLIEKHTVSTEDKMHTFTEHIAIQTALALDCFETHNDKRKLLATGGGVYNDFLIERIQYHLPQLKIMIPDKKTIEFKEALIFALLGVLQLRNEINVLSSVTGAKHDHSSGVIYN